MNKVKVIKNPNITAGEKISRKEALQKAGFIAFSVASMMILINSPAKATGSPALPGEGWTDYP
jgi:formiminotetrahydrofolate cyclodeaminase